MIQIHQFIACMALFAITNACAAQEAQKPFFPTKIGTEWIYTSGVMNVTERIAAHEKVGEETCLKIETVFNGKVISHEHVAIRPDGLYRVSIAGMKVEPALCFLKHPARAGQQWKVNSKVKGKAIAGTFELGSSPVKIGSTDFTAITANGKNFQSDGPTLNFTYYFVPGIGKVKQVISVDGKEAKLTLKEFRPVR